MSPEQKNLLVRIYSGAILVIWILAPYWLLQQFAIREIWWIQPTGFDRQITVDFHGLWLYVSLIPLLAIVGLSTTRLYYLRYLYAIGWTTMAAHMFFFAVPNGLSRDSIALEQAPTVYQWLVSLDAPRNAFPSLHAGLAVLAGLAVSSCPRFRLWMRATVWLWVFGILWSTIALRQHVTVDLIASAVTACACWYLVELCCRAEIES